MNFSKKSKQTYNSNRPPSPAKKTSANYIIREADSQDIDEVIRMQKSFQENGIKVNSDLWKIDGGYVTFLEDYYKNLFKSAGTKLVVVQSRKDGYLVGMGLGRIFQHDNYNIKKSGELIDIWVEPQYRRDGIATKIIAELVNYFKENKVEHLVVNYIAGNQTAEAFWKSFDFRTVLETAALTVKEFEQKIVL